MKSAHESWHIPLRHAALCVNCEAIFDILYRPCPACGSDQIGIVARWLDRPEPDKTEQEVPQ